MAKKERRELMRLLGQRLIEQNPESFNVGVTGRRYEDERMVKQPMIPMPAVGQAFNPRKAVKQLAREIDKRAKEEFETEDRRGIPSREEIGAGIPVMEFQPVEDDDTQGISEKKQQMLEDALKSWDEELKGN
jgi:hypothetical protein